MWVPEFAAYKERTSALTEHEGLFTRLAAPTAAGRTEADIQSDVKMLLLGEEFDLDVPKLEEQIGDGTRRRIDVAIGATVIEVKKSIAESTALPDYVEQLRGYVDRRREQTGSRYNGILTDGRFWRLYETEPGTGEFRPRASFELSATNRDGLIAWLQAVLATHHNVKPTQTTIERLLGSGSPAYVQDHSYLEALYRQVRDDPTTVLKRELWARLLRSALGTGFDDADHLFLDHTLLVIEAAAIGTAVMGVDLAALAATPASLLRGDAFTDADIHNVVESDFFDWLMSAPDGARFVSRLIQRVAVFDWSRTDHDVLKVLYESIINPEQRKGLGEYYTPDWLAEAIVEKTVTDPLHQKVLDPACGSGTFVFHAVRRVIDAAQAAGWNNTTILKHVQEHVFGLDIHPVSVVLARVTYLLALGGRLGESRGAVWVPIHLGDSIQWYQPADHEQDIIKIDTDGSDLTLQQPAETPLFDIGRVLAFPLATFTDPGDFDRLVSTMTDRAKSYTDRAGRRPTVDGILRNFGIPQGPDWDTLTETFNLLCDLNAEGRDSIWGYFVRNQVRPLWLSMENRRADVLVGNPPWLAYRYMTPEMQTQFKAFCQTWDLWQGAKVATHQDLVGLFIVRAAEKYLHDGGTFGFVTPLALLSRQQYEGFRTGRWGPSLRGDITEMWDLEDVRPKDAMFPVPSGVIFGRRGTIHRDAAVASIPAGTPDTKLVVTGKASRAGWAATKTQLTFTMVRNQQVDNSQARQSPYRATVVNGATIFPRFLFFVTEKTANNRLGQASGRTRVTSMRSSQEKKPWRLLPGLTGVVENRFLYDVHLGSTVVPYRLLPPWRAVLPIDAGTLCDVSGLQDHAPGMAQWWIDADVLWEANKTRQSKLTLLDRLDYQRGLTKQLGGATHRVIYTASGGTLAAARLDDPRCIVEHKLYWLPTRGVEEARYLVAVLNAPITTERVGVYQSRGLFGARDFDTYVWRLPIPIYDATNPLHIRLAQLSGQAEAIAVSLDLDIHGFQQARRMVREALDRNDIGGRINEAVTKLLGVDCVTD